MIDKFLLWYRGSKYCQVTIPKITWEQIARDGWNAGIEEIASDEQITLKEAIDVIRWAKFRINIDAWKRETMSDIYIETPIDKFLNKVLKSDIFIKDKNNTHA